jgi:predicted phosphodiesterase
MSKFFHGMNYCVLFLTLCFSFRIKAEESKKVFSIWPYTLRTDKGEVLLKFKLLNTKRLILKIKKENKNDLSEIKRELSLKKEKVYSLSLGRQLCGDTIEYKLIDDDGSEKVYDHNLLNSFTCRDGRFAIKFGIMSDTQENNERHAKMSKMIKKHVKNENISFVLNTGDVVHYGGLEDEWVNFFKAGRSYLSKTPLVAALGNHAFYKGGKKMGPVPQKFKRYLRWPKSPTLGYFSLEFPHFALIVFNSNFPRLNKKEEEKQWQWVEEKLKLYNEKDIPIFMAMHYPALSSSAFHLSRQARKLRGNLIPLIEKYGVKAVFAGHTHIYERSLKEKTHYITSGPTGGRYIRSTFSKNRYNVFLKEHTGTFSIISVTKKYFRLKTYNEKDEIIDILNVKI